MRTAIIRLLWTVPLVLLVATGTFFLSQASGIDPAEIILGGNADQAAVDAKRAELGLDRPAWEQYFSWLGGLFSGDMGTSFYSGASVTKLLMDALPVTISLTIGGLIFGIVFGITSGLIASVVAGTKWDRLITLGATIGQAAPSFWLGILLIYAFAIELSVFPATGYVAPTTSISGWLMSITLPSIALGFAVAASLARQTRSSMIGVLQRDYVRTALSKGLSRPRVVLKHASRNAASPVITSLSFQVAHLLGGAIVIERLFALPGIGTLTIEAVLRYDPYVIQAVVLFSAVIVIAINLLVDLSYVWLNPKVRAS